MGLPLTDMFTYSIEDGSGNWATAQVTVNAVRLQVGGQAHIKQQTAERRGRAQMCARLKSFFGRREAHGKTRKAGLGLKANDRLRSV